MYTTNDAEIRFESRDETPPQMRVLCHASAFWTNHLLSSLVDAFELEQARTDDGLEHDISAEDFDAYVDGDEYVFTVVSDNDDAEAVYEMLPIVLERSRSVFEMDEQDFDFDIAGDVGDAHTRGMVHVLRESGCTDNQVVQNVPWIGGTYNSGKVGVMNNA